MLQHLKQQLKKLTWEDFKRSLTILNILQAIWIFIVVISGAILVLVMFNMYYIADPLLRDLWLEVNIQILNGCFTIMAVITQPFRAVLAYWTTRYYYSKMDDEKSYYATKIEGMWNGIKLCPLVINVKDIDDTKLNVAENDTRREANERGTTDEIKSIGKQEFVPFWKWALIVALLNGQCIFQYPITAVHWIWFNKSQERPGWVIGLFLPLSFLCMAVSGFWIYKLTKKPDEMVLKDETELKVVVNNTI